MKAYLAIKYHADNRNKATIDALSLALEQAGFETVCIVRDIERWGAVKLTAKALMTQSFSEIDSSRVVVIDLTEKGVGLGIEAGYAYAKNIPIITIAKKGADISTTLAGISQKLFWYDGFADLVQFFTKLKSSG